MMNLCNIVCADNSRIPMAIPGVNRQNGMSPVPQI